MDKSCVDKSLGHWARKENRQRAATPKDEGGELMDSVILALLMI